MFGKNIVIGLSAAAIVTAMSVVNLVVASSLRARDHAELARRFIVLEQQITAGPITEDKLREITQARLSIEAEEPPVLRVLDCICYNELCLAMGRDRVVKLGFFQKLFANYFDFRFDPTEHMHVEPEAENNAPAGSITFTEVELREALNAQTRKICVMALGIGMLLTTAIFFITK